MTLLKSFPIEVDKVSEKYGTAANTHGTFKKYCTWNPLLSKFNPTSAGAGVAVPLVSGHVHHVLHCYACGLSELCHKYV